MSTSVRLYIVLDLPPHLNAVDLRVYLSENNLSGCGIPKGFNMR